MIVSLFVVGLLVILVLFMIWDGSKNQKEWSKNFIKARKKVAELGFKIPAYGEKASIEERIVTLTSLDDEKDVVEEEFCKFNLTPFGDQIVLYVHVSGNLAFLTTTKGATESSFVFEK